MANYCDFTLRATGDYDDLKSFAKTLKSKGDEMDMNISEEEDLEFGFLDVSGVCDFSVYISLLNEFSKSEPIIPESINLLKLSEELSLKLEIYSREEMIGFEEYYLIDSGQVLSEREKSLSLIPMSSLGSSTFSSGFSDWGHFTIS